MFIIACIRASHLSLCWTTSIQPRSPIPLPEDPSEYYHPSYVWVSQVVSFPLVFPPKPCMHLSFPLRSTCSTQLFIRDLITRIIFGDECRSLSSSLCSFLHFPVTSSLLGPNNLLKHPQPTFLLQCERPSFTPIQNNRQNYSSVYLNFYIFG